ncbi:MAG TPA: MFS transporter [Deferrisomatales bacterium]|nr:MFS transporter [Deferrisomatales bacterium]
MHSASPRSPAPDSSQAWLMLGLSCLVLFTGLGIRMSFGAYVTAWETAFGASRSQISLISSVSLIVYGIGMPIAGRMADRYGARAVLSWSLVLIGTGLASCAAARSVMDLVWLYGVVASIGFCGASSVTVSVAVMRWFRGRRGLALGVTSCGIAAGQMVVAPLAMFLVRFMGWRLTMVAFGITAATVLSAVIWLFFRDAPAQAGRDTGSAPNSGPIDIGAPRPAPHWRRRTARSLFLWLPWMIAVPYAVCGFTDLGLVSTHFIPLAEGRGFSPELIAWVVGLDALANVWGNLLAGYLADKVRLTALLAVMYSIRAFGVLLLFFAQDPVLLVAFALINGSVEAATIAPTAALCAQLYGPGKMGTIFGLVSSAHQFGAAGGAFVLGALYARSGTYASGLLLSVALLLIGATLTWLVRAVVSHKDRSRGAPALV